MKNLRITLKWKVQDCWIGVFWKKSIVGTFPDKTGRIADFKCCDIWICLVPMLPIHVEYTWYDAQGPIQREQALDRIAQMIQDIGGYD